MCRFTIKLQYAVLNEISSNIKGIAASENINTLKLSDLIVCQVKRTAKIGGQIKIICYQARTWKPGQRNKFHKLMQLCFRGNKKRQSRWQMAMKR